MGVAPDAPDFGALSATLAASGTIAPAANAFIVVQGLESCIVVTGGTGKISFSGSVDGATFWVLPAVRIAPTAARYMAPGETHAAGGIYQIDCAGLQQLQLSNGGNAPTTYSALATPGFRSPLVANQILPSFAVLVKVSLTMATGADGVIQAGVSGTTWRGYRGRLTASAAQAGSIFSLADVTAHTDVDLFDLIGTGPWPIDYMGAALTASGNAVGLHNYAPGPLTVHGYLILDQDIT